MAHGARTSSLLAGTASGAAAGPVGAVVGGAVGYAAASIPQITEIFTGKHKKKPQPKPTFWTTGNVTIISAVLVGGILIYISLR